MVIKILRIEQVTGQTGLSRSSVYKQMRLGLFPKVIKLTARSSGWKESEVQGWIQERLDESRRTQDPRDESIAS
jgi:prophage regulatory protein